MAEDKTRFLTLMFVDIPNAVAVREQEGEEAVREFLEESISLLSVVRRQHKGTLLRTVGSSLLCSFVEIDDALAAACAMQQTVRDSRFTSGIVPVLRIGVHAGDVVIRGGTCAGEIVTTSARMVTLAEPRQVVVTERVLEGAGPFYKMRIDQLETEKEIQKRVQIRLYELDWEGAVADGQPIAAAGADVETDDSGDGTEEGGGDDLDFSPTVKELRPSSLRSTLPIIEPPRRRGGRRYDAEVEAAAADAAAAPDAGEIKQSRSTARINLLNTADPDAPEEDEREEKRGEKKEEEGDTRRLDETPTEEHEEAATGNVSLCLIWRDQVLTVNQDHDVLTFGRGTESDVILDVGTASRNHAEVVYRDGGFYLVDDSGNGTFVYDETGTERFVNRDEVKLDVSGAICPGCPQEDPQCEVILFWTMIA